MRLPVTGCSTRLDNHTRQQAIKVLGPELINFTVRPTPIFLEGSASIQLTQQAARDLGLKDGQVVQGVIAARGDLLKLLVNNQELDWPASGRFNAGDKLDFRVEQSIFGRALVPLGRPVARAAAQPLSPRLLSLMHRPSAAFNAGPACLNPAVSTQWWHSSAPMSNRCWLVLCCRRLNCRPRRSGAVCSTQGSLVRRALPPAFQCRDLISNSYCVY